MWTSIAVPTATQRACWKHLSSSKAPFVMQVDDKSSAACATGPKNIASEIAKIKKKVL